MNRKGRQCNFHPSQKKFIIRPAVANVDQAFCDFAMENPKPNFMLLDRFLIMMEKQRMFRQSYVLTRKILQNRKNWKSFYMKLHGVVDIV